MWLPLLFHQNHDGSLPYVHDCPVKCGLFPLLHVLTVKGAHPEGASGANTGEDPFSWQTCSPISKGAASTMLSPSFQQGPGHLNLSPWPLLFYRYSRLAGWQQSMASPGTLCPWNTGFTESGEIGRHNWVEKLNGRKLQQAKEKKMYSKELKLIAKKN